MIDKTQKLIVILGPTASGKSDLVVKIAKKFNGEIISADSRQVYKGLNLGSGKITKEEMRGVSHYCIDVASPKKRFTVAQYQKLAKKALKKILAKGKIPIICGGSAFYIYALLNDWNLPAVPPQKKLREKLEKKSAKELFQQLKKLDPQRAKNIDKHNKRRLIRALEIILTTNKPIPSLVFNSKNKNGLYEVFEVLKIGIKKGKKELKKLISQRLKKRIKQGMIEEVKNLHQKGLSWKRLDELGLEYRYISYYLRGLIDKEKMIKILNQKIWQFAKRQMTWFKKDPTPEQIRHKKSAKIKWVKNYKEAEKLIKKFLS